MDILQSIYEIALTESKKQYPNDGILDVNRCTLEPYVYQYLTEVYGPMLREHWKGYVPPKKSEHAFVIAERRAHPNFRFILQNIAWAGPHMSVYLFCSDENLGFIEALLGDKKEHFHILPVFNGNPDREQGKKAYNTLLTDYRFYQCIDAAYMLTVQMDNILRKKVDHAMFVGDYWGNPWSWNPDAAGGGGATVRRIAAMIELCSVHRVDPNQPFDSTEDSWLSERVQSYPPLEFRQEYLMESIHVEEPFAVHQFWTFAHCYFCLSRDDYIACWKKIMTIS